METIRGFPLDDAWIHQVVARTFAESGTLGFAPGHFGAAATSHLWAALLAVNYLVFHVDPCAFTLCINVLLSLATGQLLLAALRHATVNAPNERGWPVVTDLASVAVACAGGNFVWFAYSGMEANLVAFLPIAAIVIYAAPGKRPERSAVFAGVVAGLLAVTRPECILFGPALAACTPLVRRSKKDALFFAGPWIALAGALLAANEVLTGSAIPATLAGRRWLWQGANLGLSKAAVISDFGYVLAVRLRNYTLGTSATWALWPFLGLAAYGSLRLWRERSWMWRLVMAWAALHLAIYAVLLPTPGHGGRYQPLTPLLFLLTGTYGALRLGEHLASFLGAYRGKPLAFHSRRGFFAAASLAPWIGLCTVGFIDWRYDHACAVSHTRTTELGMGARINLLPPEAKVASFDIGGIGFASTRPILDIGGLSDPATARYMREGRMWELLRERGIDYVVLPGGRRQELPELMNFGRRLRLLDNPAIDLEAVDYLESADDVWSRGLGATWNSSQRQTLYRVRYTGLRGLPTPAEIDADTRVSFSDPDHLVSEMDRDMITYGLRRFTAEGVPLSLVVSARPEREPAPLLETWQVQIGRWGLHVVAPSDKPGNATLARAKIAEVIRPYLDVGDWGGAARIALFGMGEYVRATDPLFMPSMPPVRAPDEDGGTNGVRKTAAAGILVALGVALTMMALDRWRRARG